jgi:hypothetical protein
MKLRHEAPHVSFFALGSGQPIGMGIVRGRGCGASLQPTNRTSCWFDQALVLLDVVVGHLELSQEVSTSGLQNRGLLEISDNGA